MRATAKTQPFSIRLGAGADLLIREEARRSGRARSALVEELAEEAAKTRLFPGLAFRGHPRRAWVIGSGFDVWQLVDLAESYDGDLVAISKAHPLVREAHVSLAHAYAERFPDEIVPFLDAGRRPLEELRALYPFLRYGE